MQILKSSKERLPEYNQFVHQTGHAPAEYDLDKQGKFLDACGKAAKALDLTEWKDADGSVFPSYSDLLDYQTEKFVKRYPPHFAVPIRPELTLVIDGRRLWSQDAVRLLMIDFNEFFKFKNKLDRSILDDNGFRWDQFEFNPNLKEIQRDALNLFLDKYLLDYLESQNNDNN